MNVSDILKKCDHTLLSQNATWDEIKTICDDGIKFNTASVCIPPSYVKRAKQYVGDRLKICTVIGFPNGYSTTKTKLFECKDAIENGADEIDTVINIGDLKDKRYDDILNELTELKSICKNKILKVIIETCLLSDDEKIKMCSLVSLSGADYIKTSTGFSFGGATAHDIELFDSALKELNNTKKNVKIKAAGGISSIRDAEEFIALGADRLGTSKIVKIAKSSSIENTENTDNSDISY